MKPWHEQDAFWHDAEDLLFSPGRWQAADKEIAGLLELADISPGAHFLDLCCGVGRHALSLAARGFKVTAVDRTLRYLDVAQAKARDGSLSIEFLQEDMRTFRRPEAFDAAIWFYTSIGFFEDEQEDIRVFEHLFQSLKPGGTLALETRGREDIQNDFQERDWHEEGDTFILEERTPSLDWKHLGIRWVHLAGSIRNELSFKLRLYSSVELKGIMSRVGFRKIDVRGGLDGRPYNEDATRLVILGTKPA